MATIGTLLIELSANVARLENDLGKAASHVRNTERMIQQSVNRMNGFFGLLGVSLSGAAMVGFVKSGIDAQDMLATLSEKTTTSVQDLIGLKYAAEQNSTSLESVATAGKKLGVAMADKPAMFSKMGITAKTSTDAMIQMADIFANMPGGIAKQTLAVKLFGKELGDQMIPFLNQGSDSLRKFIDEGRAMSPVTAESAARAKEFNDQLNTLKTQASGVGMQLANVMLPALTSTAIGMNELAREGHPVLALWRGLAGMGQIPWDFLMPPENLKKELSSQGLIKDLEIQIGQLERNKKSGNGKLLQMFFGSPQEIDNEISMLKGRIETIKKHASELDKNPTVDKPKTKTNKSFDLSSSTDGMQVLKALELDYQNVLARRAEAMNAPLLSTSQRALAEDLRTVHDTAAKSRVELEKLKVAGTLSPSDYEARKQGIKDHEEAQVAAITRMRTAQDELNRSWQFGAKSALRTYLDEVNNVAKQSEALFGRAFKGMEDALVQFVQTGKMDFASLRDSIIADLIRIQIQQTVTGPLAGLVGGMFGMSGTTPAANISGSTSIGYNPSILDGIINKSYEGGGFTGAGSRSGGVDGRGGFPAILHPNETVVDHTMPSARSASSGGGGGAVVYQTNHISIDSSADMSRVYQAVERGVQAGNAKLVDKLQRQGAI